MPDPAAYTYTPLQQPVQQIRLLKLKGSRSTTETLAGTLTVHNFPPRDAARTKRLAKHLGLPGYIAVSYVWGSCSDLIPSHEIILNGKRLPITAQLHAMLQSFRSVNPIAARYWIDAICINQTDSDEKSAQIPLMRDIYHLSLYVYASLGLPTPESIRVRIFLDKFGGISTTRQYHEISKELATFRDEDADGNQQKRPLKDVLRVESERAVLKGLTKCAGAILRGVEIVSDVIYNSLSDREDPRNHTSATWTTMESVRAWEPTERQLQAIQGTDFQGMATLMEKVLFIDTQYFNRMWTLQEICVAGRGLALTLGGTWLDDLLSLFMWLQRTYDINVDNIDKITNLYEVQAAFNNRHRQSLRILLAISAGRMSTDPRDRVYAVGGLIKDKITPLLRPNYTKSVIEVYANTTRHIVFSEQSLDVLCGDTPEDRIPNLPSWTPDYRHFALNPGALIDQKVSISIFKASLSEQHAVPDACFQLAEDWRSLAVNGLCLGTVRDLSGIFTVDKELRLGGFAQSERSWATTLRQSQKWRAEDLEAIEQVSNLVGKYAEYYRDSDRATFATRNEETLRILQGIAEKAKSKSKSTDDLYLKYISILLCGRIANGIRSNAANLHEYMARLCTPDKQGVRALETICKAFEAGTQGRHLIICDDNIVGAAPSRTRKGDAVYVLIGCSVPVILRKAEKPDEFEFVGECYLHGFMDGEALALRDAGKITEQNLKLV